MGEPRESSDYFFFEVTKQSPSPGFPRPSGDVHWRNRLHPEYVHKTAIQEERFSGIALLCKLIVFLLDRSSSEKRPSFCFLTGKTSLYSFRLEKGNLEDIFEHSLRIW